MQLFNIGYHDNQTIRQSVISRKEHIIGKISPLNKGTNWFFMHIFQNTKNWPFSNLNFYLQQSMSDLQMPRIKKNSKCL